MNLSQKHSLITMLRPFSREGNTSIVRRCYATTSGPRTALFFPGAGSQKVGMSRPWRLAFPRIVNPFLEEVDETLKLPLSRIIDEGRHETLTETANAQPAIFATSIMILRILEQEFGFRITDRIQFTLGHSLGEYASLCAGGYLSFRDALLVVRKRSEVFASAAKTAKQKYGDDVGMVALLCEVNHFDRLLNDIRGFLGPGSSDSENSTPDKGPKLQDVVIANINSSNQVVLAGSLPQIKRLLARLNAFGGHDPRSVVLKETSPFHHPYMQPAADYTRRHLSREGVVTFPGLIPCISNVTARPFRSVAYIPATIASLITSQVKRRTTGSRCAGKYRNRALVGLYQVSRSRTKSASMAWSRTW